MPRNRKYAITVAIKIANHPKPPGSKQSHPLETICNPPELSATTRTICNWSGTIHIHLRTPRYYRNHSKTVKEGLLKTP